MKRIGILFVFLAVLLLTACHKNNNITELPQSSSDNLTNEKTQTNNEITDYLTHLNKDMEGYNQLIKSPLLKQAVDEKAIIALNGQVLTSNNIFKLFPSEPENTDFNLYYFCSDNNINNVVKHQISIQDGKAIVTSTVANDWQKFSDKVNTTNYESYELNGYNKLLYKDTQGKVVSSDKVYSDFELYSDNCEEINYSNLLNEKKRYIDPIFNCCLNEYSLENIDPKFIFFCFEDLYKLEKGVYLDKKFPNGDIPVSVITKTVQKYFNLSDEDIIEKVLKKYDYIEYDHKKQTVHYDGGRGDLIASIKIRSVEEKDGLKYLTYDVVDFDTCVPYERYVMTVKDKNNGGFSYISIKKIGSTDNTENQDFVNEITEVLKRSCETFFQYRGDMDCDYDATPLILDNGKDLYPSTKFSSIKQLKEYTEKTFSKRFAQKELYDSFLNKKDPMMVEKDNKLYVYNGGMGWPFKNVYDSLMIIDITDKTATIQVDNSLHRDFIETIEFKCIKENGKWVLDSYYGFE